ncbi:MAG: Stp1/IreP family PP2C-type Ser/Thr phosphatase [Nitrolancea sp.]
MDELRVIIGAGTDTGSVREQNEDAVFVSDAQTDDVADNGMLVAVADGMGGYQRGEVAARIAIDTLRSEYFDTEVESNDIPLRLKQAFRKANELIFDNGSATGEQNMMGTTLVAAVIRGPDLTVANVGDSRAYLVRADRLTQVTRDHSLVAEQVAAGAMTEQEARESQHRNIVTRALGHRQRVDVDIFEIRLLPEDRLLLTSDGLHDYVDEDEMVSVSLSRHPEDASRELVNLALEHGSNDNVTAVVVWAAPAGVSTERTSEQEMEEERASYLIPMLVVLALLVFVAIVVLILYLG